MAGDEGFEPPITGPEPVALPLGQSPLAVGQTHRTEMIVPIYRYLLNCLNVLS
jgi:hypothetical protein